MEPLIVCVQVKVIIMININNRLLKGKNDERNVMIVKISSNIGIFRYR